MVGSTAALARRRLARIDDVAAAEGRATRRSRASSPATLRQRDRRRGRAASACLISSALRSRSCNATSAARTTVVKTELDNAAQTTTLVFIAIGVALLLSVIAAALALRRTVTKPLDSG